MEDKLASLENLKRQMEASERDSITELKIGDIVYVSLDEEDGLILNKGFDTRRKYIVVIGFTPEGIAVGALLINSNINASKRSPELLDCQYPILARHYRSILKYDSWLDCSDIFELSITKLNEREGKVKGSLIEDDRDRVMSFLKETDMIDNFTKRRFGLI